MINKMLGRKSSGNITIVVVDTAERPTITQILDMPAITKRLHLIPRELLEFYNIQQRVNADKVAVVKTIKVPRNLAMLKENLPVSNNSAKLFAIHSANDLPMADHLRSEWQRVSH